jgi:hypothetical protein
MESRDVVEVVVFKNREELGDIAIRAMKILEESGGDKLVENYAKGYLAMSKVIAKVYSFRWPAKVFVGWIFEDPRTAEEFAKVAGNVFTKVEKKWRNINGRRLPLVMVDLEEWLQITMPYSKNPLQPLDVIAFRYLRNTNKRRAFRQLAKDLSEFFEEYGGEKVVV